MVRIHPLPPNKKTPVWVSFCLNEIFQTKAANGVRPTAGTTAQTLAVLKQGVCENHFTAFTNTYALKLGILLVTEIFIE